MLETGFLTKDIGTVLVGKQAVKEGIIDEVGGIQDAFRKLNALIEKRKQVWYNTMDYELRTWGDFYGIYFRKKNNNIFWQKNDIK